MMMTHADESEARGYAWYPQDIPANADEYFANGWWDAHDDAAEASYEAEHSDEDDYYAHYQDDRDEDGLTAVEADAMTLRDIGWGTDEDYGYAWEGYVD